MVSCTIHRNSGKGELYLDLHGLHVDEATKFLAERVRKLCDGSGSKQLKVIPGAGHLHESVREVCGVQALAACRRTQIAWYHTFGRDEH